jgi:VanZ family protein
LKNFLKYQLPPLLWVIMVYSLSAISDIQSIYNLPPGVDKIVHAAFYFILCWLVWRAFKYQHTLPMVRNGALLGAFIFSVAFCSLDEYHQKFVHGRSADIYDVFAAAGGALLFVAIVSLRHHHAQDDEENPQS